jgi:hypothetical protein
MSVTEEQMPMVLQQILSDIQRCLDKSRVDEQMTYFIHIYSQLDEKVKEDTDIKKLYEEIDKKYSDYNFRQNLEFYYSLIEGEEGRMLFDPTVTYTEKYDMSNFEDLYKEVNVLKHSIAKCLGIIKTKLFTTAELFEGWFSTEKT